MRLLNRVNELLSVHLIRNLVRVTASAVLSSPRYQSYRPNLYQLVSRPTFTGYWILQSSFTDPQPPKNSDVTIFYLHGGGYNTSQPSTYLIFLLRIAESVLAQGLTLSIFALDYHLAPEHVYPTQLNEARAAYGYLLQEMEISPSKVVIAGDSAGGHLALSLLVDIQQRQQQPANQRPAHPALTKPEGLVLISPWLSLHHAREPSINNDVLTAPFLLTTAKNFLGPNTATAPTSPFLEFLNSQPPTDWDSVLPSWTWVSAGTNEIMFTDIASWTHRLERDPRLGRGRVGYRWGEGEVHVWQWLATIDEGARTRFLDKEGECDDFEGVVEIGRVVADRVLARM
jgi:acetyl esterase/lipase